LVLTCVVGVQALIFQDGGVAAMGTNVFNMAVVPVVLSYAVYNGLKPLGALNGAAGYLAAFAAAWVSVEAAALFASLELAASGTSPLHVVLPAMLGVHAFIGIGEGLITVAALAFIASVRGDMFAWQREGIVESR
jgi:cobalt/nickel transport system permease protein